MFNFKLASGAAALVGAALMPSTPAHAVITTYAQVQQQQGSQKLIRYLRLGSGAGTGNQIYSTAAQGNNALGATPVFFTFAVPVAGAVTGPQSALMTLNASTTQTVLGLPNTAGAAKDQAGFNGFLEFRLATPVVVDGGPKSLLLRLDFSNAKLSTTQGSTQMSFGGSTAAAVSITATSDFLGFAPGAGQDFGLSIVGLNPSFSAANNSYGRTARGSMTANFSTTPVPEPTTWAMLIAGFGMVGFAARRRVSAAAR